MAFRQHACAVQGAPQRRPCSSSRLSHRPPTDADLLPPLAELAPRQTVCGFLATYLELLPRVLPSNAVAFPTPPPQRASATRCDAQLLLRDAAASRTDRALLVGGAKAPPVLPGLPSRASRPFLRCSRRAGSLSRHARSPSFVPGLQLTLPPLSLPFLSFAIHFSKTDQLFRRKDKCFPQDTVFLVDRTF